MMVNTSFTLVGNFMLYTIAGILLVLWVLGLVTSYTVGGFLHLLLVAAIALFLVRLISGGSRSNL